MSRSVRYIVNSGLLSLIFCVLLCGCRASGVKFPKRGAGGETFEVRVDETLSPDRKKIIRECHEWLGTPYKYAGAEKGDGADCSGMVLKVYLDALDIKLPRNSAMQAEFCRSISHKKVRPGDLVFFATGKDPERISHVGIMLDDDRFIHSSTSKGVCISSVSTPYYVRTFRMYGRVPGLK